MADSDISFGQKLTEIFDLVFFRILESRLKVPRRYFFVDHLCYLFLVFVMLSCLFIANLWSHSGKGLTCWRLFVMFNCIVVAFPCGILDQVWYLIVAISDLCRLSYLGKI